MSKKDKVIRITKFVPLDKIRQDHQSYHQPELLKDEHRQETLSDTSTVHPVQATETDTREQDVSTVLVRGLFNEEIGESKVTTQQMDDNFIIVEAQKFIDTKEFDKAISLCDDVLANQPENLVALNYKGMAYLEMKKYDEAYEYLDKAYKINPKVGYIAQNRIAILARAGRDAEVSAAYEDLDLSLIHI